MDFYRIAERSIKDGGVEIYPSFKVTRSKDLMIHSKSFYAVYDKETGLWSRDEYDIQRLIDEDLLAYKASIEHRVEGPVRIKFAGDFSSGVWVNFQSYLKNLSDTYHQLDDHLTFANTVISKTDYVSQRLPYPLEAGDYSAWDEVIGTLYEPEERAKLEWAIGAIVSGDSKTIQKFLVLYGPPGSGKGTIINVIAWMFTGYLATFEAKALTQNNNTFATDAFRNNPLVAIQHDGDLSRIEDNARLNSIISHEDMTINQKFKDSITKAIFAFLFLGTNKPVKITDAKSGIIRRLIDVNPSGRKIPPARYQALMSQIRFELGPIAQHCLDVYREMGKNYYENYRATEMMLQTDVFYNFIEEYYEEFKETDGTTLQRAYDLYKNFCKETHVEYVAPRFRFRDELRNYFHNFDERPLIDGVRVRSWYSGFITDKFKVQPPEEHMMSLVMDEDESIFDSIMANQPAQYSNDDLSAPRLYWDNSERYNSKTEQMFTPKPSQVVSTKLADLDTSKEHYVKVPENHIVIDFDLTDETGEKSAERNLAAASEWPPTYSEFSKSGAGVHLHYNYTGDVSELSRVYSPGIEVKVYTGNSSLRRRLSKCNNVPVAAISSGLPFKEKKVLNEQQIQSEKGLRDLVIRNLNKEIHDNTASSVNFIAKILEDAYRNGLVYDLTDMRSRILAFANGSTNQSLTLIKVVSQMKFKSADIEDKPAETEFDNDPKPGNIGVAFVKPTNDEDLVIFDVEVFPNLFVICWKYQGASTMVKMINPTAAQVEQLMKMKLVGFNNLTYDNHILWGAYMGMNNEQLYQLSKKIVTNVPGALFGQAYSLSYTDIYDFLSAENKASLKKLEIMLGLPHKEFNFAYDREKYDSPFDSPVPPELWEAVADYCANDVEATDAVFVYYKSDWQARKIIAALSGLTPNDRTNKHSGKIIFGNERNPKSEFVYTDLTKEFPGYEFDATKKTGKSTYKGEDVGEGGFVYAEPGMYQNVVLLDVASMHPTSIEQLNMFGKYTEQLTELKQARLAIKRGDFAAARKMMDGKLAPFLEDESDAKGLSDALKTVINSIYGVTAASFDNIFRDIRNVDNIAAKRGALFMVDLKEAVQKQGFIVAHIKTDSIKIPDATPEIIQFVMDFGKKYGYTFEHEKTFSRFTLVNESTYIAKVGWAQKEKDIGKWDATGAQFAVPYVYKTLFSKEPIVFKDLCEAKFVQGAQLWIDFTAEEAMALESKGMQFIGKAGLFTPIKPEAGGGLLVREKDGKFSAATGTKGYLWLESEMVETLHKEDDIDMSYFNKQVDAAVDAINKYGDFEWFIDQEDKS